MRKIFSLISAFLIIGVGIYFILQGLKREINIVDILPEGAVFYGRIIGLEQKADAIKESPFWQQVKTVDFKKVLEGLGVDPRQILLYEDVQEKIFSPETRMIFNKFFGQEAALSVYPPLEKDWTPQTLMQWPRYFCLVTRLRGRAPMMELLAKLFTKFESNMTQETVSYKKHKIHILSGKDNDVKIGFTRIGDLIVFGMGDDAARRCIDVYKKERNPLSQDPEYLKIRGKFFPDSEAETFWNLGIIGAKLKTMILQMAFREQENADLKMEKFRENLNQFFGIKCIGASMVFDPVINLKWDLFYDREAFSPQLLSLYSCSPKENQTLSFIAGDVKAYQWSSCYDFKYYWQQIQKGREAPHPASPTRLSPEQVVSALEQNIGLDIARDILPLLGDEMGYALWDIDAKGIFPVPEIMFIIRVVDSPQARQLIDALWERQNLLRLELDNYQGHVIRYFNVPLFSDLQPAYAMLKDYLLISSKRQLLRRAIDTMAHPQDSLLEQPQFKDARLGLTQQNNSILFLQLSGLVSEIDGAAGWLNERLDKEQAKQEAFQNGQRKVLADMEARLEQNKKDLADLKKQLQARESQQREWAALRDQIKAVQEKMRMEEQTTSPEDLSLEPQWLELKKRLAELKGQENQMAFRDELDALQKRSEVVQGEILADEEKAEEVRAIIAQFKETETPVSRAQRVFLKNLMRPLLKALGQVDFFATRTLFLDQVIEGFIFLKSR